MNEFNQGSGLEEDDAIERLLREASPRPVPSRADETAVRSAVRGEWNRVTGRRQRRRRVLTYAIAASVLVGVFGLFNAFRAPLVETVQVATIDKTFGPVYLLGETAELSETHDLAIMMSGETIVTGDNAGIALSWGRGGSLRIDENTRVEFSSSDSIYLRSGRIYFDSRPSVLVAGTFVPKSGTITVASDHGRIRHVGTQFMTSVAPDSLTVSVREGQVAIDGRFHDHMATHGEQVTLSGSRMPSVLSISGSGESWSWVGRTSPAVDVDGRTLHEYLIWACRELGLALAFEGEAEQVARNAILRGSIDTEPSVALRQRLATAAFSYRVDEGVMYVSETP